MRNSLKWVQCSVTQLCLTLCDTLQCSPQGSSVHGLSQARILEWVAIYSSRGSSCPRDWTSISCIEGGFFAHLAIGKNILTKFKWNRNWEIYLKLRRTGLKLHTKLLNKKILRVSQSLALIKGEFPSPLRTAQYMVLQFSCSVVSLCDSMDCSTPGLPVIINSQNLPKLMFIESVMATNHLILCHRLLLLPPIFPSIRIFSYESALHIRWPKYWSFSFIISPSKEHPGLVSFRMGWLDLLAAQGTLKSLPQRHSSKVLILWHSAFFIVQLSHPYMTTGITIALTRWTFVDKVMSLLFNMLSKLVTTFLPRNQCLLISWLSHHLQWFWSPQK